MEEAVKVSVGAAGGGCTVNVMLPDPAVPAEFVQVSLYVCDPATVGVIVRLPLVACEPLQFPDAVQLVASTAAQDSVELPPGGTVDALSNNAGATNATSAWINPYPELKLGPGLLIGTAPLRNAP